MPRALAETAEQDLPAVSLVRRSSTLGSTATRGSTRQSAPFDAYLRREPEGTMNDEPERDGRATDDPQEKSDPEPTPGEDEGPMGNPAEDEEALRHEQEDSGGGDG